MKGGRIVLLMMLCCFMTRAQDIHFTQFMRSPMNLNPATAGAFDCTYRFATNYRSQWRSVTVPYVTFGLSADANSILNVKGLGAGLSVYNDKAGDSEFSTLQVNLAASYTLKAAADSTKLLSFGLQSGVTQRSINYSKLTFDNQYNGYKFDPTLGSNEVFSNSGRTYANLNAGMLFRWRMQQRKHLEAGLTLLNINKPKQSFYDVSEIRLDRRFNAHAAFEFPAGRKLMLKPYALVMMQGKYAEYLLTANVTYDLSSAGKYMAAFIELGTRFNDAGYAGAGMHYGDWTAAFSYDLNYSGLVPASNYRGGLELALIYKLCIEKLPPRVRFKICPEYL